MNKPHRKLDELMHPNHETLPDDLKYFASCLVNIPQLLDEQELQEMLQKEGHKSYFIDNVVNYMANPERKTLILPVVQRLGYKIQLSMRTFSFQDIILFLETTSLNHMEVCVYMLGRLSLINVYLNWKIRKWRFCGRMFGPLGCLVAFHVSSCILYIIHQALTIELC